MADHAAGGLGYAHAMRQPKQPRKESTILDRWRVRWEGVSALNSKLADDPSELFSEYKLAFRRRMDTLLRANISWQAITSGDLDSPLQTGTEFDRGLCLAIERRRSRMNRVKGSGKKYAVVVKERK
jgi:hypothetical protein